MANNKKPAAPAVSNTMDLSEFMSKIKRTSSASPTVLDLFGQLNGYDEDAMYYLSGAYDNDRELLPLLFQANDLDKKHFDSTNPKYDPKYSPGYARIFTNARNTTLAGLVDEYYNPYYEEMMNLARLNSTYNKWGLDMFMTKDEVYEMFPSSGKALLKFMTSDADTLIANFKNFWQEHPEYFGEDALILKQLIDDGKLSLQDIDDMGNIRTKHDLDDWISALTLGLTGTKKIDNADWDKAKAEVLRNLKVGNEEELKYLSKLPDIVENWSLSSLDSDLYSQYKKRYTELDKEIEDAGGNPDDPVIFLIRAIEDMYGPHALRIFYKDVSEEDKAELKKQGIYDLTTSELFQLYWKLKDNVDPEFAKYISEVSMSLLGRYYRDIKTEQSHYNRNIADITQDNMNEYLGEGWGSFVTSLNSFGLGIAYRLGEIGEYGFKDAFRGRFINEQEERAKQAVESVSKYLFKPYESLPLDLLQDTVKETLELFTGKLLNTSEEVDAELDKFLSDFSPNYKVEDCYDMSIYEKYSLFMLFLSDSRSLGSEEAQKLITDRLTNERHNSLGILGNLGHGAMSTVINTVSTGAQILRMPQVLVDYAAGNIANLFPGVNIQGIGNIWDMYLNDSVVKWANNASITGAWDTDLLKEYLQKGISRWSASRAVGDENNLFSLGTVGEAMGVVGYLAAGAGTGKLIELGAGTATKLGGVFTKISQPVLLGGSRTASQVGVGIMGKISSGIGKFLLNADPLLVTVGMDAGYGVSMYHEKMNEVNSFIYDKEGGYTDQFIEYAEQEYLKINAPADYSEDPETAESEKANRLLYTTDKGAFFKLLAENYKEEAHKDALVASGVAAAFATIVDMGLPKKWKRAMFSPKAMEWTLRMEDKWLPKRKAPSNMSVEIKDGKAKVTAKEIKVNGFKNRMKARTELFGQYIDLTKSGFWSNYLQDVGVAMGDGLYEEMMDQYLNQTYNPLSSQIDHSIGQIFLQMANRGIRAFTEFLSVRDGLYGMMAPYIASIGFKGNYARSKAELDLKYKGKKMEKATWALAALKTVDVNSLGLNLLFPKRAARIENENRRMLAALAQKYLNDKGMAFIENIGGLVSLSKAFQRSFNPTRSISEVEKEQQENGGLSFATTLNDIVELATMLTNLSDWTGALTTLLDINERVQRGEISADEFARVKTLIQQIQNGALEVKDLNRRDKLLVQDVVDILDMQGKSGTSEEAAALETLNNIRLAGMMVLRAKELMRINQHRASSYVGKGVSAKIKEGAALFLTIRDLLVEQVQKQREDLTGIVKEVLNLFPEEEQGVIPNQLNRELAKRGYNIDTLQAEYDALGIYLDASKQQYKEALEKANSAENAEEKMQATAEAKVIKDHIKELEQKMDTLSHLTHKGKKKKLLSYIKDKNGTAIQHNDLVTIDDATYEYIGRKSVSLHRFKNVETGEVITLESSVGDGIIKEATLAESASKLPYLSQRSLLSMKLGELYSFLNAEGLTSVQKEIVESVKEALLKRDPEFLKKLQAFVSNESIESMMNNANVSSKEILKNALEKERMLRLTAAEDLYKEKFNYKIKEALDSLPDNVSEEEQYMQFVDWYFDTMKELAIVEHSPEEAQHAFKAALKDKTDIPIIKKLLDGMEANGAFYTNIYNKVFKNAGLTEDLEIFMQDAIRFATIYKGYAYDNALKSLADDTKALEEFKTYLEKQEEEKAKKYRKDIPDVNTLQQLIRNLHENTVERLKKQEEAKKLEMAAKNKENNDNKNTLNIDADDSSPLGPEDFESSLAKLKQYLGIGIARTDAQNIEAIRQLLKLLGVYGYDKLEDSVLDALQVALSKAASTATTLDELKEEFTKVSKDLISNFVNNNSARTQFYTTFPAVAQRLSTITNPNFAGYNASPISAEPVPDAQKSSVASTVLGVAYSLVSAASDLVKNLIRKVAPDFVSADYFLENIPVDGTTTIHLLYNDRLTAHTKQDMDSSSIPFNPNTSTPVFAAVRVDNPTSGMSTVPVITSSGETVHFQIIGMLPDTGHEFSDPTVANPLNTSVARNKIPKIDLTLDIDKLDSQFKLVRKEDGTPLTTTVNKSARTEIDPSGEGEKIVYNGNTSGKAAKLIQVQKENGKSTPYLVSTPPGLQGSSPAATKRVTEIPLNETTNSQGKTLETCLDASEFNSRTKGLKKSIENIINYLKKHGDSPTKIINICKALNEGPLNQYWSTATSKSNSDLPDVSLMLYISLSNGSKYALTYSNRDGQVYLEIREPLQSGRTSGKETTIEVPLKLEWVDLETGKVTLKFDDDPARICDDLIRGIVERNKLRAEELRTPLGKWQVNWGNFPEANNANHPVNSEYVEEILKAGILQLSKTVTTYELTLLPISDESTQQEVNRRLDEARQRVLDNPIDDNAEDLDFMTGEPKNPEKVAYTLETFFDDLSKKDSGNPIVKRVLNIIGKLKEIASKISPREITYSIYPKKSLEEAKASTGTTSVLTALNCLGDDKAYQKELDKMQNPSTCLGMMSGQVMDSCLRFYLDALAKGRTFDDETFAAKFKELTKSALTDKTYPEIVKICLAIYKLLEAKGWRVIPSDVYTIDTVLNKKVGELDLLVFDKMGQPHIIDVKCSKLDNGQFGDLGNLKVKYSQQLSVYRDDCYECTSGLLDVPKENLHILRVGHVAELEHFNVQETAKQIAFTPDSNTGVQFKYKDGVIQLIDVKYQEGVHSRVVAHRRGISKDTTPVSSIPVPPRYQVLLDFANTGLGRPTISYESGIMTLQTSDNRIFKVPLKEGLLEPASISAQRNVVLSYLEERFKDKTPEELDAITMEEIKENVEKSTDKSGTIRDIERVFCIPYNKAVELAQSIASKNPEHFEYIQLSENNGVLRIKIDPPSEPPIDTTPNNPINGPTNTPSTNPMDRPRTVLREGGRIKRKGKKGARSWLGFAIPTITVHTALMSIHLMLNLVCG